MLSVYTDGACKGNPGIGGYSFVVVENDELVNQRFGGKINTTNNQMELTAVMCALRFLLRIEDKQITIYSDSAYIVNCMQQGWYKKWKQNNWRTAAKEPVKNQELWSDILDSLDTLIANGQTITFVKVKGHAGHKWNELADQLANKGAQNIENLINN